jgi:hypothetical protein
MSNPARTVSHLWNLAGGLQQTTLPSTRIVQYGFDGTGRVSQVSGTLNGAGTTYASLPTNPAAGTYAYTAHGAVQQMTRGDGVSETTMWNSRLQPTMISAGSLWSASLYYCGSQQLVCTGNNGNVMEPDVTAAGVTNRQRYQYDGANRLCAAAEGSVAVSIPTCTTVL